MLEKFGMLKKEKSGLLAINATEALD